MSELAEKNRAFAAAISRGDVVAAANAYAANALLQPPSADAVEGREQIAAFWQAGMDSGVREVQFSPSSERLHDGMAFEIGTYSMRIEGAESGTVVDRGRYLIIHERQPDGSWLFAVEMLSPDVSEELGTR
jgi:ketosteroid isomerase-like protein